ncbi:hypothetical protein AB0Q95_12240 [Streptomyces sp. NPDC059900]|uniref:hypothetical protein n=1 Tax=Streptomyces sp. NPDC059900 TaxID=3155816 RepID=UPI0034386732
MIHPSETLALQTVEDFLTRDELIRLRKFMDDELHTTGWVPHFEAEVLPAPPLAQEILGQAVTRALPAIRRAIPSIASAAPWGYTELTAGQRVPTHLDGIPDPGPIACRLGRIGVVLDEPEAGGEFYVETTSSDQVWTGEHVGGLQGFLPGTPLAHRNPHAPLPEVHRHDSEPAWLTSSSRTRWTTDAGPGTAIAYGAHLIHGVRPVRTGRLRKFVTDLLTGSDH